MSTLNQEQQAKDEKVLVTDENLKKFKICFKSSIKDLELLLQDFGSANNNGKESGAGGQSSSKEDRIHGYLLIILEIVRFSSLDFEKQIEKYLCTYNLYHQKIQKANNNLLYNNEKDANSSGDNQENQSFNNTTSSTLNNSASTSSNSNLLTSSNLIENTANSCEELHAINLLKLLPHSYLDPLHTNDPFLFLFKSEKISVNVESYTCSKLISARYDQILKACFNVIKILNLSNPSQQLTSSSSLSSMSSNSGAGGAANFYTNPLYSFGSMSNSSNSSSMGTSNATQSQSSVFPPPPQSAFRCIQETIMELLPRLAKFNPTQFNAHYLKESVQFLSTLNNNTNYLSSSSTPSNSNSSAYSSSSLIYQSKKISSQSTSSSNTAPPLLSQIGSINNSITGLSSGATFCLGTLKSEVIFCVGFMSLALSNTSGEFRTYAKQFIEIFRTSPIMNSREIQRKRETIEREAQINELNSIMACVAMFANSMVTNHKEIKKDQSSLAKAPASSNLSENSIIDSIMVLLEPLMLGSGGVTYTMRYFLNEISLHIPELKASIYENLLKILSQILTGRPLHQIIQSISTSASHLIRSNNFYSLMSHSLQASPTLPSLSSLPLQAQISQKTLSRSQSLQSQSFSQMEEVPPQVETECLLQALQTLRAFEFPSIYLIAFLRYCVDFYLQHESRLVKIEAIISTTSLLSRLISTLNSQDSRSLISIISCVLRKLLICAITDNEADVRYHVLNSLDNDNKFNMFVSLPENLNILFMCVRDERAEIRELSASMISRLSASNSAYILPFIRKILMQLLTEVDIYPDIAQREKSVRLMGHLLCHAPRLVNLYVKPLLDCLHSKLCEYRSDIPFASSIVTVVGQLASQSGQQALEHFDSIIPFLIELMQDFYYVQLKHTAIWALGQIIANTGYCIEPYKRYPNLLEILMGFLQTETSKQIRRETIRILGLLGAIDPFEYKKTLLKSKREEFAQAAATAVLQQQLQQQTMQTSEISGPYLKEAQTTNLSVIVNTQPGATAAAQASAIAAYLNNSEQPLDPIEMLISMNSIEEYYPALAIHLMMKTIKNSVSIGVRRDALQALVFAMRGLDTRCVNYVELVIPPFLDLIRTMNDNLVIDLIEKLGNLVTYIKKFIEPYLTSILKIVEHYWVTHQKHPKMISALIDLVQSITNVMDIEFKRYLPQVLPLILKQLQSEIHACAQNELDLQSSSSSSLQTQNALKILNLLRLCTCCLENYVHLILSQFAEYLTMPELQNLQVKQEIMFTIYTFARQITLSDNCAILFQSFIKILEQFSDKLPAPSQSVTQQLTQQSTQPASYQAPPILSITYLLFSNSNTGSPSLTNEKLNASTDLGTLTIETLYLLSRQMSGRFFVYAPMFDRILLKNKNYSKLYEQLMINCREATYHTLWSGSQVSMFIDGINDNRQNFLLRNSMNNTSPSNQGGSSGGGNSGSGVTTGNDASLSAPPKINFGNIKVGFDRSENITSKEGWGESFKNFMSSIVTETPISTLSACGLIPYDSVPPDLFNACYISIWVKLGENQQNDIIHYLELALKNSNVPEIIKIILNLAEFIERCDVGLFLPLDYHLLAEKAFQVKDYAKALHYVEEQFHAVMISLNTTASREGGSAGSSIIGITASDHFNGVGGVSGAGGGSNSNRMASSILNKPLAQQQQFLVYLLEQLVTLNHELQRTEAAMGVLDFASKYLKSLDSQTKVKERWYEKLHQWKKALTIYEKNLSAEQPALAHLSTTSYLITDSASLTESKLDMLMGRMRCLKGLGEWQKLNHSSFNLLNILDNNSKDLTSTSTVVNQTLDSQTSFSQSVSNESDANVDAMLPRVHSMGLNPSESTVSISGLITNRSFTNTHQRQSSIVTSPSTASNISSNIVVIQNTNSTLSTNTSTTTCELVSTGPQTSDKSQLQLTSLQEAKLKENIAEMGAAACWGLGDWDQMKVYAKYLPETTYEGSLYRSVLALTTTPTINEKQASLLIEQTRDLLDPDLTSMASQSYERSYQAIIEAEVLSELEEIITYRQVPTKRDWLIETWWKRLQGCERSLEYWHRLLLVRPGIVIPLEKEIKPWLKFSSLCQKVGHLGLAQQILSSLLTRIREESSLNQNGMISPQNMNKDYELCRYANLKYLYANGGTYRREALNDLREFVNSELMLKRNQCQSINDQLSQNLGNGMGGPPLNIQQLAPQFQINNVRDLQKRTHELDIQLSKCYLKLGFWHYELDGFNDDTSIGTIINYYKSAKDHNQDSYKAWHAWAYVNYEALQYYKNVNPSSPIPSSSSSSSLMSQQHQQHHNHQSSPSFSNGQGFGSSTTAAAAATASYVKFSIEGYFMCIKLSSSVQSNEESNCLQDTLRLLTLWFDYCVSQDIFDVLNQRIRQTPMEIWLQVIPQLIARIDTNKYFVAKLIHNLLTEFGKVHPQALVYRLILASKVQSTATSVAITTALVPSNTTPTSSLTGTTMAQNANRNAATIILQSLREHNNTLVDQAILVSEELIRVAILWHENWHESLEEASKLFFGDHNTQGMLDTLEPLHNMMDRGPSTNKEIAFLQAYGRDLNEAREFCRKFTISNNVKDIDLAWEKYYSVFKRITKQLPQMTSLELGYVSPKLMVSRDLELAVPGTYEPNKPLIRIRAFNANIQVISSKQRPRKISIFGSNGFEYVFLLKGHEDLRQDERVMQIFGLVNNLLLRNHETARRDLAIQRYNVIPLSQNSGLLEWLLNCDTLHSLIREYREKKKLLLNLEHKIITKLAPNYESLTSIQKVQIFEMAIESSSGNDLSEILWHKSLNAEKWLERRTNYTRSLAVMSMVGYVLGLGDRHPSNLMLDRNNGKIIHVDFGDCFETAMTREKFPERIPFRLTRMLKNAMEVTGIEGTFRRTCESVMKVLRSNLDSVMAVLEAFVYDPLVYWKLVEANNPNLNLNLNQNQNTINISNDLNTSASLLLGLNQPYNSNTINAFEDTEETNRKAIKVLNRVRDKLLGTDFSNGKPFDEVTQVDLLIRQATSSENLSQCFIGWCAWW
jgi:phosphatidylinositol kinase/protein kinase (PI-3  family)